jgi:hypothetical protein
VRGSGPEICHFRRSTAIILPALMTLACAVNAQDPKSSQQEVLTNESVVQLVKANIGTTLILQMIQTHPGVYSFTSDSLIKLKQQGVPDAVLSAMMAKQKEPNAASAESGSSNKASEARTDDRRFNGLWELEELTDRMSDQKSFNATMHKLVGNSPKEGEFQVTATCNEESLVFKIAFLSNSEPKIGLKQNTYGNTVLPGGLIGAIAMAARHTKPWVEMRVRLDQNPPSDVSSEDDYVNEAIVSFTGKSVQGAMAAIDSGAGKMDEQMLSFARLYAATKGAGTIDQAFNAHSILVQLPLDNGMNRILEMNPQDASFRAFESRCNRAFPTSKALSGSGLVGQSSLGLTGTEQSIGVPNPGKQKPSTTPGLDKSFKDASKEFTGTAEHFAGVFPEFLQSAAQALGDDAQKYSSEGAMVINGVRACAGITPRMAKSVTSRYGQVDLRKLGDQYRVCMSGVSTDPNGGSFDSPTRSIVARITTVGTWGDGQGFEVDAMFVGMQHTSRIVRAIIQGP